MWFVIVFAIEPSRYQRQTTQNIAESQTTESSCLYCDSSDVCPSVFTRWKKRIIVQNVNQRPYVYFKWTLKSSFCSYTKDRKSDVSTIQFIVFFILYFYILVTEHSRFLIHTQLFTSYWTNTIALLHSRARRLLYSLTWKTIALFFNYNKGSV